MTIDDTTATSASDNDANYYNHSLHFVNERNSNNNTGRIFVLLSDGGDGDQYTQMNPPPIIIAAVVVVVVITIIVDGYTNVYNVLSLIVLNGSVGNAPLLLRHFSK